MSKIQKSFICVLFVVMALAALLSPAPRLLSDLAGLDNSPKSSEAVAYTIPSLVIPEDFRTPCGYTWAG